PCESESIDSQSVWAEYALKRQESVTEQAFNVERLGDLTIHQDGGLIGEPLNIYIQCGLTTRDEYEYDETYNWTLDDCKRICWDNCSCIAYSYATKNRKGCKTYGKMIYNPTRSIDILNL
nr:G-type lectin S-receptor-like serine/threonine-protein kinase At1g67520 [Tanacetum cinerariifolium]GFA08065.1 G-type lectin S-receptor-like serine/threonine-protein kinase At1g67520 [Tanacetum cinerariifolium]